jgi:hypothetical protein
MTMIVQDDLTIYPHSLRKNPSGKVQGKGHLIFENLLSDFANWLKKKRLK